jgi:hypothetical protein
LLSGGQGGTGHGQLSSLGGCRRGGIHCRDSPVSHDPGQTRLGSEIRAAVEGAAREHGTPSDSSRLCRWRRHGAHVPYRLSSSRSIPTRTARIVRSSSQSIRSSAKVRVAPELSDPVGSLEVGEHEDVEQLGAGSRPRASRRSCSRRSSSSGLMAAGYVAIHRPRAGKVRAAGNQVPVSNADTHSKRRRRDKH